MPGQPQRVAGLDASLVRHDWFATLTPPSI